MHAQPHPPQQAQGGFDISLLERQESKRTHERVRRHWLSLKENRRFPREDEIDPSAIDDVWDYCFLVDMRKGGVTRGFRYDYMGPALLDAYGVNLASIESCDAATLPHCAMMLRQYDEVVESGEPATHEAEFENVHRLRIKYRCCLLPLGKDRVEYILGCMRWKPY